MYHAFKLHVKRALRRYGLATPPRSDALADEVKFWDRWLCTQGAEWPADFAWRLDPNAPLGPYYSQFIDALPGDAITILDVGAGPLTAIGKCHPSKRLHIVATDFLANEYALLLQRYNIKPIVPTIFADAERLADTFNANTFDLVVASNCIDHLQDPLAAIKQMLVVAKKNCYVVLFHAQNEAENQNYEQLHQWNFTAREGKFIIRGKGKIIDVSSVLEGSSEIESIIEPPHIKIHIRKKQ